MSFCREEILSLRKDRKSVIIPTIDPMEVLATYPSFDMSEFNARIKKVVLEKYKSHDDLIEKSREKLKTLIDEKIAITNTNNLKFLEILNNLYDKMINSVNLNKFENPMLYPEKLSNLQCDDISCDSVYDYDGYESFECWKLAKYTHSDPLYLCLQDLIHNISEWDGFYNTDDTWSDVDIKNDFSYMKTMKFLSSIGFKCWFVSISMWSKGYDYNIYDVSLIKKSDYIKKYCRNEPYADVYCRYYVSFNPIDYD
jgi:hypothetical protein